MTWLQNLFNFLALSLLRLFAFLPYSFTVLVGYGLGWLAAHIPSDRAQVVKTNLRLCFPNLSAPEIDALALEHWKLFGRSVIERSRIWLGTGKQITDIVTINSAITLGDRKPRLLINPHFVGLEGGFMALSVLANQHDWPRGAGLYQNMKNPFFNQKMIEWRNRFGIVYGMWGLLVFGPILATYVQMPLQKLLTGVPYLGALVSGPPVGIGILSAGIILAIMIIPFIASVMRDVFEVTPPLLKESAYGLGSTTWEVMSKVVLPYTKAGVVGGIMLGLGRALGETMAVTFVIGNMNQLNSLSVFEAANSITSALANEFAEASSGLHQASLIYLGLVLFFITFVVLAVSKVMLARMRRNEGAKS